MKVANAIASAPFHDALRKAEHEALRLLVAMGWEYRIEYKSKGCVFVAQRGEIKIAHFGHCAAMAAINGYLRVLKMDSGDVGKLTKVG